MGYYESRQKAFKAIDMLCKESNHSRRSIIFDAMRNTGMSEKALNNYIDELIALKVVADEDGVLKWIG